MKLRADLLESLVEFAPDALLLVDAEGVIVYANTQAATLFGCTDDDIVGRPIECLLPSRFRERHVRHRVRFLENKRRRPMGAGLELFGLRWDGSEFPIEISLSPLCGGGEGLIAAAVRDATARKRAERELIAARETADRAREAADRTNQSKSRFLATASHDLRQPLQALAMLNGTLRRMALSAAAHEACEQQTQAIDAMRRLLNALLDISKLESGAVKPQMSSFPLAPLFEELRNEFADIAAEKRLELAMDAAGALAHSDRSLVEQVLRNLISNAVKYTRAGRVAVRAVQRGEIVRLEVQDTGFGIPREQIPFIFDEFFQVGVATNTTRHGYGLGLSIVQRIAGLLDSRVEVRSTPGRGSTFAWELPSAASAESPAAGVALASAASGSRSAGGRVLLVEDHPGVLRATQLLLAVEGFTVVPSQSRSEALSRIAEDPNLDLLITDYHLSGAETGVEVIAAVRSALHRELPVVLVTGDTSSAVRTAPSGERVRFVSKPIDADELLTVVQDLLENAAAEITGSSGDLTQGVLSH